CVSVAAALLSACGGSQPPIAAPGAMLQSSAAPHAAHGKSWMLPEASGEDLLYVTKCLTGTCVVSYPAGELGGTVDGGRDYGAGACVDARGNVFITNTDSILEYTHGGSSPIATLSLPGDQARGCSVDPVSGNLAVVYSGSDTNLAIFPGAQGSPVLY